MFLNCSDGWANVKLKTNNIQIRRGKKYLISQVALIPHLITDEVKDFVNIVG